MSAVNTVMDRPILNAIARGIINAMQAIAKAALEKKYRDRRIEHGPQLV